MIPRLFRLGAWLASGLALTTFALRAAAGVGSPAPLEATERGLLELATRLAAHLPIYPGPGPVDMPALLPGFPLVASVLVDTLGAHLHWLRLISLLSIVALGVMVMSVVQEETENRTLALASGSIMLAGYCLLAGDPAAARPEPLMLALALGGGMALRSMPGAAGGLIAALMLSAACFTHAQGVWFAAAALVYLLREDRGRLVAFTLGVAVFLAGSYLLLSHVLGPWFNYHAWDQPVAALRFDGAGMLRFVGGQLLGTLGVLTVMTVLSFALPTRPWRGPGGLWPCFGVAAVAAGLLATQSVTPEPQSLAICVAALALVGPISMHRVIQHLSAWPDSTRLTGEGVVLAALVLQFVALFAGMPPGGLIPGL
jgi:hypothetical protein